jgi:hypothetical protein
MILAILVLTIPVLLATWVSYWSTNLFKSLSNRTSRIACLVAPGFLAVTTLVTLSVYLGASGTDIDLPDLTGKYAARAFLLAITALLVIVTLLIALVAGGVAGTFKSRK